MPKTLTILRVFAASPSDLDEERQLLTEIIDEYNLINGDQHGIRLELVKWETHTRPGFAADAQDAINRQIGDEFDLFIGMMWTRFGTPSSRGASGTEEEFERAYTRLKRGDGRTPIMFYFKDAPISPSKIDPEQLNKVSKFKSRLSSEFGALYREFTSSDDFRTKVRIHLSKLVEDSLAAEGGVDVQEALIPAVPPSPSALVHFSSLVDDDEEGLYELSERANESMGKAAVVMERIGETIRELGDRAKKRTAEFNLLNAAGAARDMKAAKRIADTVAEDLEFYVKRMALEVPEFHKEHSRAMETFGKAALLSRSDFNEPVASVQNALDQLRNTRKASVEARRQISSFRDSVAGTPRMTSAFNRARKRAVAITDDLLSLIETGEEQTGEVEALLEDILDHQKQ